MPGEITLPHAPEGSELIRRNIPIGNWQDITYGNGWYIAVSYHGTIVKSDNTYLWQSIPGITSRQWKSVIWTGSRYIAVANGGYLAYSTDATNWTQSTALSNILSDTDTVFEIASDNNGGLNVLYGNRGRVYSVNDGNSWFIASAVDYYESVTYGNGYWEYVASGSNSVYKKKEAYSTTAAGLTYKTTSLQMSGMDYLEENQSFYTMMYRGGDSYVLGKKDSSRYTATFDNIGSGVITAALGEMIEVATKRDDLIGVLSFNSPDTTLHISKDEGDSYVFNIVLPTRVDGWSYTRVRCCNENIFVLGGHPTEGYLAVLS